jgi:hypothetical protein
VADSCRDTEAPGRADAGLGTGQEGFEIAGAIAIARIAEVLDEGGERPALGLEACTQIDERLGRVEPPVVPRPILAEAVHEPIFGAVEGEIQLESAVPRPFPHSGSAGAA